MTKARKQLVCMVISALMAALSMVLSRFLSVNLWNVSVGFAFVPLLICGLLCGPIWCGAAAALADFVGALLFPFGAYFFGFTAVAFLNGILYGMLGIAGEKVKNSWMFLLFSFGIIAISETVCSLLLNSLWISVLYGAPYIPTVISRILPSVATLVLGTAICTVLQATVMPKVRKIKP